MLSELGLTGGTGLLDDFRLELLARGSLGWEMCGFASVDKTMNGYTVWVKRPIPDLEPPTIFGVGWRRDPSGRFQQRYWDGYRWTEHVSAADGQRDIDAPFPAR